MTACTITPPASGDLRAWAMRADVQAAHAEAMSEFIARGLPERPAGRGGRGAVLVGGGPYAACVYVAVRALRHVGWRHPVQVWSYPGEVKAEDALLLADLGVEIMTPPDRGGVRGWNCKAYAAMHSGFDEVLYLDADCYPAGRDPSWVLDGCCMRTHGAVFWPDVPGQDLPPHVWGRLGLPQYWCWSFESGQFAVDVRRCWRQLALADWINANAAFYYRHVYGDKDTFCLAWRRLGSSYGMPRHRPRMDVHTLVQHDCDGRPAFLHRVHDKWRVRPLQPGKFGPFAHTPQCGRVQHYHRGLPLEAECHRWLAEYRRLVLPPGDLAAERELSGFDYLVEPAGVEMHLCPGGRTSTPARTWRIEDGLLFIDEEERTIGVFTCSAEGTWTGRWMYDQRRPTRARLVLVVPDDEE